MTEIPIQIGRLPLKPHGGHPTSSTAALARPSQPSASATGSGGFKISIPASRKQQTLNGSCGLVFRNFYVASLHIEQVNVDGSATVLAENYLLMQHVHCEDDAQNWQLVKLDQLPVRWDPAVLDSLCVYLSQPSRLWETWELRDVKLVVLPSTEQQREVGAATKASELEPAVGDTSTGKSGGSRPQLDRGSSTSKDRLSQLLDRRTSRSSLAEAAAVVNPATTTSVEEQATRCLDLVLRLRELLHH